MWPCSIAPLIGWRESSSIGDDPLKLDRLYEFVKLDRQHFIEVDRDFEVIVVGKQSVVRKGKHARWQASRHTDRLVPGFEVRFAEYVKTIQACAPEPAADDTASVFMVTIEPIAHGQTRDA